MSTEDRRAPGATRLQFDALVEVGGALGPSFEAQALNVSEEGIQLRTAYLPEPGQPLTCRFDGGPGQSVLASGKVVWAQGADKGGEFGVRFTDMDPESVDALKRICGVGIDRPCVQPGSKVRLHIDGLASPMRAKIKDSLPTAVTVGSDLGFLQVGRELELEDAQSGSKRPASIDRVEVAVDPDSHVPQLVVTLRYSDAGGKERASGERGAMPREPRASDDLLAAEEASLRLKGAFAHGVSRVAAAFERFGQRVKTTISLLAKRRGERLDDATAPRRTTAPPPGGGLHAAGRRVVRGDGAGNIADEASGRTKPRLTKRKVAVASAVMASAIVGALVLKTTHHDPGHDAATGGHTDSATTAGGSSAAAQAGGSPSTPASPSMPATVAPATTAANLTSTPSTGPGAADDGANDPAQRSGHKRHARVAPFGNGPVHHGNVLQLKMDGAIESIEGAQQPTGFTVKLPGRRLLEAAGPLAARDSRIAAMKVSNDAAGAELTVTFKDGVPNYQVNAKGDTLVIDLAPAGGLEKTMAKKGEKGAKSSKHARHEHDDRRSVER